MKAERRPRTPDESLAVTLMRGVSYPVASWDKRFMRSMSSVETITEKEAHQLWRLFIKYRRQVELTTTKTRLLTLAETLAAPDLRKLEKARKEQAEVDELKRKYKESMDVEVK